MRHHLPCTLLLLAGLAAAGGCLAASSRPGPAPAAAEQPAGPDLAGKTTVTLDVRGMSCGGCVATVTRQLREVAGVRSVQGNPTTGQVTLTLAPDHQVTAAALVRAVEDAGYTLDKITPAATGAGKP